MTTTTYQQWPEQLRLKRGLFNGKRVQLARESRGIARHVLARKVGITTAELVQREQDWAFWTKQEQTWLTFTTDYPIAFFTQDNPPVFDAPIFYCGTNEDGETHCHVDRGGVK